MHAIFFAVMNLIYFNIICFLFYSFNKKIQKWRLKAPFGLNINRDRHPDLNKSTLMGIVYDCFIQLYLRSFPTPLQKRRF